MDAHTEREGGESTFLLLAFEEKLWPFTALALRLSMDQTLFVGFGRGGGLALHSSERKQAVFTELLWRPKTQTTKEKGKKEKYTVFFWYKLHFLHSLARSATYAGVTCVI